MIYKLKSLLISLLFVSGFAHSQTYGSQPAGSVVIGDLEWLRCSVGQTWIGTTCIGEAKQFKFNHAQETAKQFNAVGYDGKKDWRVPTIRELLTIRTCSTGVVSARWDVKDGQERVPPYCNEGSALPPIDANQFPNTLRSWYWSSSISKDDPSLIQIDDSKYAFFLDFLHSNLNSYSVDGHGAVRLVRSTK